MAHQMGVGILVAVSLGHIFKNCGLFQLAFRRVSSQELRDVHVFQVCWILTCEQLFICISHGVTGNKWHSHSLPLQPRSQTRARTAAPIQGSQSIPQSPSVCSKEWPNGCDEKFVASTGQFPKLRQSQIDHVLIHFLRYFYTVPTNYIILDPFF